MPQRQLTPAELDREIVEWGLRRDRARKDLFFLANEILSPPESRIMVHHAHDIIVNHCQKFFGRREAFVTDSDGHFRIDKKTGAAILYCTEPRVQMWDLPGSRDNLLLVSRGHLKALDIQTPLPTPDGWKLMRDVKEGDKLFGSSGQVVTVTGISDTKLSKDVYEVEFSTGETIVCDGGHLWETTSKKFGTSHVMTTDAIAKSVKYGRKPLKSDRSNRYRKQANNHKVRVAGPLDLMELNLPIPPYTLGAWLGDGESAGARITTEDEQILEEIAASGTPVRFTPVGNSGNVYAMNGGPGHPDYYSGTGLHRRRDSLHCKLADIGVLNNKHIPEVYLRASFGQRLALLQGLMDTDGTIGKAGQCVFTNMNRGLVESVRELILSLGLKAGMLSSWKASVNGKDCGTCYGVGFYSYPELNPFRLKRKASRVQPRRKVSLQNYRHIVAVRPVAPRFVKCIMVDSPDSLYLAGRGFIPTHNTTIHTVAHIIQWIINYPDVRILMCTATDEKAQIIVGKTKQHFQYNPRFRQLFPEFCPPKNKISDWGSKTEFSVPNRTRNDEPTLMTAAVGKALASTHHDVIKASDVVTENNIRTDGQIMEVKDFFGYLEPLRERGPSKEGASNVGWKDVEGTIYHFADYYQMIVEAEEKRDKKAWKITKQSCWTDEAKTIPLWPERFPAAELHRIEESPEVGPVLFASQYELNPITGVDGLASPEQIRFFPAHLVNELMPRYRVHTTIDLANMDANSLGDYTVITTCGFDGDGRCDVLSIVRGHFDDLKIIELIFAVQRLYPSNADFKIQKDHFSASLRGLLKREQAKRGTWLNIMETPVRGSKNYRIIKGLQGWFLQGSIRFADNIPCKGDLIREIVRFPKGRHDDILDTLADQFGNKDANGFNSDVYPDAPKFSFIGMQAPENRFQEFDPLTKEAKWLYDTIESASPYYESMTGI